LGSERKSRYTLVRSDQSKYVAYNDDGNLSFFYNNERVIEFTPDDAQHIVNGVIFECANGLGRVSLSGLKKFYEYWKI